MNIVERIARLIEPGAYGDWYDGTGAGAKPIKPSTRAQYKRAKAEHTATEIVKLALASSPEGMREDLAAFDIECWKKLGLDHPDMPQMVRAKHGLG